MSFNMMMMGIPQAPGLQAPRWRPNLPFSANSAFSPVQPRFGGWNIQLNLRFSGFRLISTKSFFADQYLLYVLLLFLYSWWIYYYIHVACVYIGFNMDSHVQDNMALSRNHSCLHSHVQGTAEVHPVDICSFCRCSVPSPRTSAVHSPSTQLLPSSFPAKSAGWSRTRCWLSPRLPATTKASRSRASICSWKG